MKIDVNTAPKVVPEKGDFVLATHGGKIYIHLIVREAQTDNYTGVNLTADTLHKQDESRVFNTPMEVYKTILNDNNCHNVKLVKADKASMVLNP